MVEEIELRVGGKESLSQLEVSVDWDWEFIVQALCKYACNIWQN